MEMMAQQQGQQGAPQQNPTLAKSSNRMEELLNKARTMTGQETINPSIDQIDNEQYQEMFNALPDDAKQQIMELPVDQQQMAIYVAYQKLMQQEQMAAQGEEQMMEGEVEMEGAGMSPEDVAAMAEQQALEMMYGGKLPKAQKGRNQEYMNAYTDAAKALGVPDQEIERQIKGQKFADKMAYDEMINTIPSMFNPKGLSEKDLTNESTQEIIRNSVLKAAAERNAQEQMLKQMHNDINKGRLLDYEQERRIPMYNLNKGFEDTRFKNVHDVYDTYNKLKKEQQYDEDRKRILDKASKNAYEQRLYNLTKGLKQFGGQTTTPKPTVNTQPVVDQYADYVSKLREPGLQKIRQESGNPNLTYQDLGLPVSQFKNPTTGEMNVEYMYGDKKYKTIVPKLPSRDEFTKLGMSKPMASKAQGGYPDSTINRPGYTNEYFGDQYRGKSYEYQNGGNPYQASAHMPRGMMSDRFNPLMGNHVDPYSYAGAEGDASGQNGRETFDSRPKFVQNELAKSKQGGMIGKTIQYKKGGQVKSGKIIGISKTGKYIVK
jgi:hypothetical protein